MFAQWYDDQAGGKPTRDAVRVAYHGYIPEHATLTYIGDETRMTRYLGRMRWYDARLGRWLTRDPAGYVDGLNVYLFVRGNPLSFVDPSGLQSEKWAQEPAVDAETGEFLGTNVWDENDVSKPVNFIPRGIYHKALEGNPDHCEKAMLRQDPYVGQAIADIQDATAEYQGASDTVLVAGTFFLESGPVGAMGVAATPLSAKQLAKAAKLAQRLNSGDVAKASGRGIALMKRKGSLAVGWKFAPKAGDIGAYGTARYKAITGNSYRHNLKVFTGGEPDGHHAHHILTRAMEKTWREKFPGINIHDPRYLEWRPKSAHFAVSKAYEKQMRSFMEKRPNASIEEIMKFGKRSMDDLISKYNQRENR